MTTSTMTGRARVRSRRMRIAVAAIAAIGLLMPLSAANTADAATTQFRGGNWADGRDNFVDGWVIPSGMSSSDTYASAKAKGESVASGFSNIGANIIRLPINPASVNSSWWNSYTGAIDGILAKGLSVQLAYWEGTNRDGKVDDTAAWTTMWRTVVTKYGSNSRVYFSPMNEPHGYSDAQWRDVAAGWLQTHSSVPRSRVFISGSGYSENLSGVCSDSRLSGTFVSLHQYAYWANRTYSGWASHLRAKINECASRVVVDEYGTPMTTGINYHGSSTSGSSDTNNNVAFIQAMTDVLREKSVGAFYWPILRDGDSYALANRGGSGNTITLSINNQSGRDKLRQAWGL